MDADPRQLGPGRGHRSVLVYVGLDLIGDGLIKLPFIRAIRQAWPQAHVTWMAGIGPTVYSGVLRELAQPYIDEVLGSAGVGHSWREVFARPLPGRSFDLVIDTQRRFKTTLILRRIRHGTFVSGSTGFLLSDLKPARPHRKPRNLSAYLLSLVELASGRPARFDRQPRIPEPYRHAARLALPAGPYLGLAPGAGGTHKRWPLARFIEVGKAMQGRGLQPAFFLGPQETGWDEVIRAGCPGALLPLQDGTVPPELSRSPLFTIACAQRLAAAVANDAGTGHLFAAADTPLLSLFGPTPSAKFAPSVTRGALLHAQEFGGPAMELIPVEAVLAALDRLATAP